MASRAGPGFGGLVAKAVPSFWHSMQGPTSPRVGEDSAQTLERQLRATRELVRPGFMALRAMRDGDRIVDFAWTFASAAAGRILGCSALDLYGKRLRVVLAGQDACEALFIQYRRVIEQGAASATKHVHPNHGSHDTYRHGAVRLGDGVAVTLINLSAAHRVHALESALLAQPATCASRRLPVPGNATLAPAFN